MDFQTILVVFLMVRHVTSIFSALYFGVAYLSILLFAKVVFAARRAVPLTFVSIAGVLGFFRW